MFSLERILRRTRGAPKDIKAIFYDGTTKTLADHPDPTILSFAERNEEFITQSGKPSMVDVELDKMQAVHDIMAPPLDKHVKYIIADRRRFPVYILHPKFVPGDMSSIATVSANFASTIEAMHKREWVIWNIHDKAMSDKGFTPQIILNVHPINAQRTQSIIMGSSIVSPYQVLHDILSSRYECDEIPYDTFKTKFAHFWGRVLPVEYRHVPDVCQFYHEMYNPDNTNGDYIDTIIKRWCIINKDDIVLKDPKKLVEDPQLFYKVDWFAFAMVLDGWIEQVVEKDPSASPPPEVLELIKRGLDVKPMAIYIL
jgi:hypothetical protein